MANPVPYNQLFDIDGLKSAIIEAEQVSNAFNQSVTDGFTRNKNIAAALRKELELINNEIGGKSIKLFDESAQSEVLSYAKRVSELTAQIKSQQQEIDSMTRLITAQKQAVQDAKIAEAEYRAELQRSKVEQQEVNVQIAKTALQIKELTLSNKLAKQTIDAANGSYTEAQRRLTELGKSIRGAAGGFEAISPEIEAQIKQYNDLNSKLKDFDAKMGNFQRNVGNYKSGFNGLQNSINQISRELPAFTNSMQTGFLAISNNLPILADEIVKTRTEIAALKAEGQAAPTLFESLAKGVFSWGTALSLGITLLTIYGPQLVKFIGSLFQTKEALDESKISIDDFNKALQGSDFLKAVENVDRLKISVDLAKKGFGDKTEVLKDYNDTLGKSIGQATTLDQAEQSLAKNADNYIKATLYKAAANIALGEAAKKAADVEALRVKNASDFQTAEDKANFFNIKSQKDLDAARAQVARNEEERRQKQIASAKQYQQAQENIANNLLKTASNYAGKIKKINGGETPDADLTSVTQIRGRISELQKQDGSAIAGSELNNRIKALQERLKELGTSAKEAKDGFAILEDQLSKLKLKLEDSLINDQAKNYGRNTTATLKYADAVNKLTDRIQSLKDAQARAETVAMFGATLPNARGNTLSGNDAGGIANALTQSTITGQLTANEQFQQQIIKAYNNTKQELLNSYKSRNINIREYDEQLKIIEQSESDDLYDQQRNALELRLALVKNQYGLGSKQYAEALEKITNLDKKHNDDTLKNDEAVYAQRIKLRAEAARLLQQGGQNLASATGNQGLGSLFSDLGTDLVNGVSKTDQFQAAAQIAMDATATYTDFALNASRQRQAALEKELQYEVQGAGSNAEARQKIEAEYTKRINAEKQKQAKLNKAQAVADIVLNTAVAITKVLGQTGLFGIPLAAVVGALGAIELGIALATPIPQYFKGREDGKAEVAEVNERGAELLEYKGNYRMANAGKRGLTYLRKGERVITADKTTEMINRSMVYAEQSADEVGRSRSIYDTYVMKQANVNIDYDKIGDEMRKAVGAIPVQEHNWNDAGYQRSVRNGNSRIKDVRNRNQF